MPLTVAPELRWLATACRQDATPLGKPPCTWDAIAALATRHRVESLLLAGLRSRGMQLPDQTAEQLNGTVQRATVENLQAIAASRHLQERFSVAGLPLLFVKGLTLSSLAYGSATLKMSRDLDLLVRPGDLVAAGGILADLGYRLQEPGSLEQLTRWHRWSKESSWLHPSGLLVELHSRLTDHPGLLGDLSADSPAQQVPVAPGVALPTLRREPLLAYLAVHGASSAWFRLKWLADLHALLAGADASAPDDAHRAMLNHGAGRAAGQALLLLEAVYDLPLGERLARTLRSDRRTRWLAGEALRQLSAMREPTKRRWGTVGIHASQLLLGDHASSALAEGVRRTGEILFRRVNRG